MLYSVIQDTFGFMNYQSEDSFDKNHRSQNSETQIRELVKVLIAG